MKKLLVFLNKNNIKPTGGPYGYMYNLNLGLKDIDQNDFEIHFLDEPLVIPNNNKTKKILPKFAIDYIASYLNYKNLKNNLKSSLTYDFSKYDIVHFHSTLDLYRCRECLKDFKGKVLLTSHSPQPNHQELIEGLNKFKNKVNKKQLDEIENVDIFAFDRADCIIFPCKVAEEPYFNRWDKYKSIRKRNAKKIKYMTSGIKTCTAKVSRKDIREKYGIPENAFLISYVGRHNAIKGYDILKNIGESILKNKDIYIIVAGMEGPLYRLENKKWIEVGWTNDPHSIIAASDVFVLPNRETYFDLVFLEVLSLGTPLLVSKTGGNKYFSKFKDTAIYYFENEEECIKQINKIKDEDKKELNKQKKNNIKLHTSEFSEVEFAKRYLNIIGSLYGKEK